MSEEERKRSDRREFMEEKMHALTKKEEDRAKKRTKKEKEKDIISGLSTRQSKRSNK